MDGLELDSLELRCLSVQHILAWMVAAESTLIEFIRSSHNFRTFYIASQIHRRLLDLCCARHKLRYEASINPETPHDVTVHRTQDAGLPLLTYYDYVPTPIPLAGFNRLMGIPAEIDIREETPSPSSSDFLIWYYRTIDSGFALASHAHLVVANFVDPTGVQELQDFARVPLSFRWVNNGKKTAVIVMRSVAEATELFELYEDEESGSEGEFHFTLRPLGNAIVAPYIEDTQLRKLRQTYWNSVVHQWCTQYKCDGLTIVAFNMNEKFTMQDLEKSLDGIAVSSITLVNEGLRLTRRMAYVVLVDHAAVRSALDRDGRNVHGKALRIQMMPPLYDYNRQGSVVASKILNPLPSSTTSGVSPKGQPTTSTPNSSGKVSPPWNAQAKEFIPKIIPTAQLPPSMTSQPQPSPAGGPQALGTKPATPTTKWVPNPNTPPFRPMFLRPTGM